MKKRYPTNVRIRNNPARDTLFPLSFPFYLLSLPPLLFPDWVTGF